MRESSFKLKSLSFCRWITVERCSEKIYSLVGSEVLSSKLKRPRVVEKPRAQGLFCSDHGNSNPKFDLKKKKKINDRPTQKCSFIEKTKPVIFQMSTLSRASSILVFTCVTNSRFIIYQTANETYVESAKITNARSSYFQD